VESWSVGKLIIEGGDLEFLEVLGCLEFEGFMFLMNLLNFQGFFTDFMNIVDLNLETYSFYEKN
jgi:hypothetical protein